MSINHREGAMEWHKILLGSLVIVWIFRFIYKYATSSSPKSSSLKMNQVESIATNDKVKASNSQSYSKKIFSDGINNSVDNFFPKAAIFALQNGNKLNAIKIIRETYNLDLMNAKKMIEDYILTDPKLVENFKEIKEKTKLNVITKTKKSVMNQAKEDPKELFPEADQILHQLLNNIMNGSESECSPEEGYVIQTLTSALTAWLKLIGEEGYKHEDFEQVLFNTIGALIFLKKSDKIRSTLVEPEQKVTSKIVFQVLKILVTKGDIQYDTYENIKNNLFAAIADDKIIDEINSYYFASI